MSNVLAPATPCASCGEPMAGRYCASCGERRLDPEAMTLRHFFLDSVFGEISDIDSRVWRTVRGVFKPAFLTREYWAGRRRLYVTPVRLFLIAIVVYAVATQGGLRAAARINSLTLSVAPVATPRGVSVAETVKRLDPWGWLGSLAASRLPDLDSERDQRAFHDRLDQFSQPLSFSNVLLLAFVLYVVFRRRHRLYAQHGVFAMHYMTFVLLTTAAVVPVAMAVMQDGRVLAGFAVVSVVMLAHVVYLGMAVSRFYLDGMRSTLLRSVTAGIVAFGLFVVNAMFTTLIQMLGAALALVTT